MMIETKQRVRIVGPPGSIHYQLAARIARYANVKHINLAKLHWQGGKETDLATRQATLKKQLIKEQWIVVGDFSETWAEDTIDNATMILLVKEPKIVCFFRIFFQTFGNIRRFFREVKLLFSYNKKMKEWRKQYRVLRTKSVTITSSKEGFQKYLERTKRDLKF